MLPAVVLRASGRWQFDLSSAIIGALVAWCLVALAYSRRAWLRQTARRIWEPVADWRRRQRASQEEKYLQALRERLKPLLWLVPDDPAPILRSRSYRSLAPLPTTLAEVGTSPRTVDVPQPALLAGHPKLIITGSRGSGRTTTLLMAAMQADGADAQGSARLPIWIDLALLSEAKLKAKASGAENLVALAVTFLPALLPSWVLQQVRREPCLMLIDHWEMLTPDEQAQVSAWIAEAAETSTDIVWLVTAAPEGYGQLTDLGFMVVDLLPYPARAVVPDLYRAWCSVLDRVCDTDDEETEAGLTRIAAAAAAGAPLWELHLRCRLHIETGELPERPVEVVDRALQLRIESVDLGRVPEDMVPQARRLALDVLAELAGTRRLDGAPVPEQALRQLIASHAPPEVDRTRRLEAATRKLIEETALLQGSSKDWQIVDGPWRDYLAAGYLVQQETGEAAIREHLDDPGWTMLLEFYAGIGDMGPQVDVLANRAEVSGDVKPLLRIARWGVVADPDEVWRKEAIKVVAQSFVKEGIESDERLQLGQALAYLAGDGARAFFMQVLRRPSTEVRSAALRGIGWCGSPRDLKLLSAALRDTTPELRESAAWALRDVDTPEAFAVLAESLPHVDEALMPVITRALASTPDGWQALEDATEHPDLLVRRAAALGLGSLKEPWATERLLTMAREDSEWLVRSAAEARLQAREEHDTQSVRVPSPPKPDELDWLIAWAARQGTGLGVGDAALDMLARAAREGNVDAKILSALTLAHMGREGDIPTLESLLGHEDPAVTRTAAWALNLLRQRYPARTPVTA